MKRRFSLTLACGLASAVLAAAAVQAVAADNASNAVPPSGDRPTAAETPGKCGGGKGMNPQKKGCGMMRMDSNGDGKVSREEFMQGHAAMFDRMDTNGDGMVDMDEKRAFKAKMKAGMSGKCGQGKGDE